MTRDEQREIMLEYRTKHPDCWYCALRFLTPCHCLCCRITNRHVSFTRLRARLCKHYEVEVK